MPKTEVVVVRHGETNWNASGRIQGFLDIPLNERGRKQARRLTDTFADQTFDVMVSSDLTRTLQTAYPLSRRLGHSIQTRSDMREWNLGCFENHTTAEARTIAGEAYEAYRRMEPDMVIPNGESFRAFFNRCVNGMEDLVRQHPDRRIILFTHGGVVINFIRKVQRVAIEDTLRYWIPNTAHFTFQFEIGDRVEWVDYTTETELVPWFGTAAKG